MSIMSAKYKAHKLVNVVFYIIVFVFGFLVGIGVKKININNVLSRVLMIDNAYAYTLWSDSNNTLNEEAIYNRFSTISGFDINETPYIQCEIPTYNANSGYITCTAWSQSVFDTLYAYSNESKRIIVYTRGITSSSNAKKCVIQYNKSTKSWVGTPECSVPVKNANTNLFELKWGYQPNLNYYTYTNYNPSIITSATSNFDANMNKFDFSSYTIPEMVYDEDLFDNDSNFKEVCVNNYDTFSITSNEYTSHDEDSFRTFSDRDAMWFKGYVYGLNTYIYKEPSDYYVPSFYQDTYYFYSAEAITELYSTAGLGYIYEDSGYDDKYLYYGYSSHLFINLFDNNENTKTVVFNTFSFKDAYIQNLDGEFEYPDQYCFYIKNDYDVNILNKDEWGDVYGDISILGDTTYNFHSNENFSDLNSNGLFSSLSNFISQIRSVIVFINTNIYNFYLSMPLIVRMFITSILTIFFIKYIIDMLVR